MSASPESARESAAAAAGYGIRLDEIDFEGPLDLLLYLIKKNEVEVTDIPMAPITEQFLGYLERIRAENLEAAGDFLLMAATLLRIKARMLLPAPELEEEDPEDPRRELVDQLLEYQQYKEAARRMREREEEAARLYPRGYHAAPEGLEEALATLPETEARRVTLADLLRAFAAVLAARPAESVHRVEPVRVTLEDRVRHVRRVLADRARVTLVELFPPEATRIEMVVTLIALLEMVRNREVRLRQEASFGEIAVLVGEALLDEAAPVTLAEARSGAGWGTEGDPARSAAAGGQREPAPGRGTPRPSPAASEEEPWTPS